MTANDADSSHQPLLGFAHADRRYTLKPSEPQIPIAGRAPDQNSASAGSLKQTTDLTWKIELSLGPLFVGLEHALSNA